MVDDMAYGEVQVFLDALDDLRRQSDEARKGVTR